MVDGKKQKGQVKNKMVKNSRESELKKIELLWKIVVVKIKDWIG